ncbi:SH3 domain-containing protein [Xanthobacter sp. TB0139]|uniref:SH3 domain-containing protein n=1 Tax=Xanthobacter sp. TB0139 TaxID=3459178 RepID=UPI00403A4726
MGPSSALAAETTQPDPTMPYQVTGVAHSDVLNIREQPGASAPIIGTLAPDATNILITGSRTESGSDNWWQVLTPKGAGWVNARYLAPTGDTSSGAPSFPLRCMGTEPFWSLTTQPAQARFSTPESNTTWAAGEVKAAHGIRGRFIIPLKSGEQSGLLAVWRNPSFCTDGMSDIGFPYESILVAPDGNVYAGCCQRGG